MAEQGTRRFLTPPRRLIPWITRVTVWLYRLSEGRIGGTQRGMDHVLLTTVGRRSGEPHTVCLPIWRDAYGAPVVVASYAGAQRNPAWYHNLRDRDANPTVSIMNRADRYEARADVLDGGARLAAWEALVADRPFYAEYQADTDRMIPLVRLVRTAG
jgi:deazaflavin-dependent oxidoreductase (nitroreductase family)